MLVFRTQQALRPVRINETASRDKFDWVKNTPSGIRDEAMQDLLKAYRSNFAKLNKQQTEEWRLF